MMLQVEEAPQFRGGRRVEVADARDVLDGVAERRCLHSEVAEGRVVPKAGAGASTVTVLCADGVSLERARGLSERLGVPLAMGGCAPLASEETKPSDATFSPEPGRLYLKVSHDGLSLARDGMELMPDFAEMLPRVKPGALQREMLVKAARVKGAERPWAVDATAGLGEDSFLLAAAGFEVTLCEADPVVASLLADTLARAARDPELAPIVARMHLVEGDSRDTLAALAVAQDPGAAAEIDVIYLDPMFPGRTKSAAVKKKFQLIHGLERPADPLDESALLQAALAVRPRKIVVKRPVKGPHLAGVKPSHSIAGKAVRYDCIVPPR